MCFHECCYIRPQQTVADPGRKIQSSFNCICARQCTPGHRECSNITQLLFFGLNISDLPFPAHNPSSGRKMISSGMANLALHYVNAPSVRRSAAVPRATGKLPDVSLVR